MILPLLQQQLQLLNLANMARHLEEGLRQAREEGIGYDEFLLNLTALELRIRQDHRERRRLKEARFPMLKPLESFDFAAAPCLDHRLIRDLARADFVKNRQNVILLGRCGTGKTHLAIALGMAACQHNYAVRFTTGYNLANDLSEARSERLLSRSVGRYSRYNLLILDELGYIPFTREGAELLFQVLAERHERGSVIITTNLGFADWTQIFGDATMTAALLDRLTHRAVIISCDWESYRLKQSLKGGPSYDLTAKPETHKDAHPPAVTGKGPRDPVGLGA